MASDLYIDDKEGIPSVGDMLDQIIRKVSLLELADYYMGSYVGYDNQQVKVYFSPFVTKERLEELVDTIDEHNYQIALNETDDNGGGFVLVASGQPISGQDNINAVMTGNTDTTVSLDGDIEVKVK